MMTRSDYNNNNRPKFKKLSDIPDKYWPPAQIGPDGQPIPWAETPATYQHILNYAENARQSELDSILDAKRQKEQRQVMERREKQQEEQRQRQIKADKANPDREGNEPEFADNDDNERMQDWKLKHQFIMEYFKAHGVEPCKWMWCTDVVNFKPKMGD